MKHAVGRTDLETRSGSGGVWLFAALLLVVFARAAADDAMPKARRFRESVAMETNLTAQRELELARIHLTEKRWKEGYDLIRQATASHPGSLVPVEPGRYLNVELYSQLLLAALPPEGLAVVRQTIDDSARQAYEDASRHHDPAALRAVVRDAFVSRAADDALLTLGQWAWESSELTRARGWWERLLPLPTSLPLGTLAPVLRYPDTHLDKASVLARLVMCTIVDGDEARAAAERAAIRRMFPEASGLLGGREGKLADRLDQIAADSRRWSFPPRDTTVWTLGVNAARNGVLPAEVDVGALRWVYDLPADPYVSPQPARFPNDRDALRLFPVVFGDFLFVNTADQILGWNVSSGKPAWAEGHNDSPVIYSSAGDPAPASAVLPALGAPRYTMTVREGRLYARMGDPTATRAREEPHESNSHVVCLDLERGEGKLIWKATAAEIDPQAVFEGSPLVMNGRAYAAVRKGRPQLQTDVVCLDAETGRRIWDCFVGAEVTNFSSSDTAPGQQFLTAGDDAVFLSTGTGAIAAIEADAGTLRWVVTYESDTRDPSVARHDQRGAPPCLFAQNRVIAAPGDFDGILVLESRTGLNLWRQSVPGGIEHLLGTKNGVLIASGKGLWGFELATGRVVWHLGFTDPASFGYGRGILAGDVVYWPTREDIYVVDQATGALRRRIPLLARYLEMGGNLILARDALVVAGPRRLLVFGPQSGPAPKQKDALSQVVPASDATARATRLRAPTSKTGLFGLPIRR